MNWILGSEFWDLSFGIGERDSYGTQEIETALPEWNHSWPQGESNPRREIENLVS